jgi:nitrogen fixation/metabolism regulation signal transduction histidine kinase
MLRKFQIIIIIRVIVLVLTTGLFFLALRNLHHVFSITLLAGLMIAQTILLIRHATKINRDLKQFYESVMNQDGTVQLMSNKASKDSDLNKTLNEITTHLSYLKKQKEVHYNYLKLIVNQLNAGIIAFNEDGKVDLINNSALELLQLSQLNHLNELKIYGNEFIERIWNPSVTGNDIIELKKDNANIQFSLRSSTFKLDKQTIHLCSFHNIKEELETAELQSWKKLLRVITHEIMNSVSPIVSLTTTLNRLYIKNGKKLTPTQVQENHINDTIEGIQIINRRGEGLLSFVKNIRKIHLLPKPTIEQIKVKEFFEYVLGLMREELVKSNIEFTYNLFPENIMLEADRNMLEQMIINLINNSIDAMGKTKKGRIELKAFQDEGNRKYLQVIDNGEGIAPERIKDIFIPYFSTKENGSGIGLSLCRQIMRLHKGDIYVDSVPNAKTTLTLKFLQ